MISPETLIFVHSALSLVALGASPAVIGGLMGLPANPIWPNLFLVTAISTSLTGFLFPIVAITPALVTGVVALLVFAAVLYALHVKRLAGPWARVYAVGIVASVYLLVLAGITQAFLKIPSVSALDPTLSGTPFFAAQLAALALFVGLGIAAARRFTPGVPSAA